MHRIIGIAFALASLIAPQAYANEQSTPPEMQFVTTFGYAANVSAGTLLPPTVTHGLGATFRLPDGWGYNVEIGAVTSMSALQPCIQVVTGPTKKVSDGLGIGVMAMYRCAYAYDGTPPLHIVGISAAPALPLKVEDRRFGGVAFPVGASYIPQTGDITVAFNVKLALFLPKGK